MYYNLQMPANKIFIGSLSSFIAEENKYQVTAAEQLEQLFTEHGIDVLKNKKAIADKRINLLSTVFFVLINIRKISIAILPLFGTFNSIAWYRILAFILKIFKKKVICFVRGGTIPAQLEAGEKKFYKIFRKADVVVAPSAFIQTVLAQKNIYSVIIENPLQLYNYPFVQKNKCAPSLLWMRSFHHTYNPLMMIRVAKLLSKKYPSFKLVMAGNDRGLLTETTALVKELGLQNNIVFPGYIDIVQKRQLSGDCDIFISTNRIDNAPVSLVEFMAFGLPVVTVNTGGIPYMIEDGVNGLLAENDNDAMMCEKISLLINNYNLFNTIRKNAAEYAMRYDESLVINKWKELFIGINRKGEGKVFIASLSSWLPTEKKFLLTASDQLTELFIAKKIPVYRSRHRPIKFINLLGTIFFLLTNINKIRMAVLPLYGTPNSIRWYKSLAFILKRTKKKIICVVHGGSIPVQLENGETKFDAIFKQADAIVTPSGFIHQCLNKINIPSVIIKNPLATARYMFSSKTAAEPKILWMRSFHNTYNPLMAVRVAAILSKKYPGFKMTMAGNDRGLLATVKTLVTKLQLEDKIFFPGYIDLAQKEELAKGHDIFISTNKIDNAPVSIIEFMALGLPVVAVNTGGIPFIVDDEKNGLLAGDDDDYGMAYKISMLIENPVLYNTIRNKAREYAMLYNEDLVIDEWTKLFTRLEKQ